MEYDRLGIVVAEITSLLDQQLSTLDPRNFSRLTESDLFEYEQRYRRIRELCQQLGVLEDLVDEKEGKTELAEAANV